MQVVKRRKTAALGDPSGKTMFSAGDKSNEAITLLRFIELDYRGVPTLFDDNRSWWRLTRYYRLRGWDWSDGARLFPPVRLL
ncbi:MAG: hypothetical protein Q7S26_01540 [bacterium]|nr:hypothetical protein [bacterium]